MKKETPEIDFAFHTLLYRASVYARNRYLSRKYRLLIQYYGSLLEYSLEEINQHILETQRHALAVRRRKEKEMRMPPLVDFCNRAAGES